MAAIAPFGASQANNVDGAWLSPASNNWPLIAIHAALTPDGRVLSYGTDGVPRQTGFFIYDLWNPNQPLNAGHITLNNTTATDIFCSSQIILPQSGSIFIAGGDNWTGTATTNTGNNNSNIFDYTLADSPATQDVALAPGNLMNRARWYSSSTVLPNGEIYVQGGNGGGDRPEVRQADGAFRLLSGANTSSLDSTFPRNFLAPDGRVFGFEHSGGDMYYVNTAGTGQITMVGQIASQYVGWTSGAAMYRPGKILQMGGNSNNSVVIDITGPVPVVTPVAQLMSSTRKWVSATVLADGRVLATGGSGVENQLNDVNTSAEIWNPDTNQWSVGPSGSRARLYHSGALLLPDASVLVTGGGAPGPLQNKHSEIYYPSYLYNGSGGFATRPVIQSAPSAIDIGEDFTIDVGSATIERLTLVKTGSVTHSVNMDQRFLELPFIGTTGTVFVPMTDKVTDAPPGYYLLFAFNQNGVPSRAKILRVNVPANPVIQLDYTAVIGGTGGSAFEVACNADEALVGVYGNSAGTFVNRVGLRCVQVDESGRWIGSPVNRGTAGPATGTAYTKTCPQDWAISGYRGRSGTFVNQLDYQCRALTATGKVTGSSQYLGTVGGSGGTAQGPFSCSTSNPAYSLNGRSGTQIDAFGMKCREVPLTQLEVNAPPSITHPGNQVSIVGNPLSLQIVATDADLDPLTFTALGLPPNLDISTSGLVSGTPTTIGTFPVSITAFDGTDPATINLTWTITNADPLVLNPMPQQAPNQFGTPVSYTATVQNAINPEFKWFFDDGTETGWSSSPSVSHTFTRPSMFWVSVTAKDDRGVEQTQTFSQLVHLPLTAARPVISGQLGIDAGRLWVVNQDNNTVSVFNTTNNQKVAEIPVGSAPRALAFAPNGDVWVTNRQGASISVLNPSTLTVSQTIGLPHGSQPYGIVFAPDGGAVYVALEGAGRVVKLNPSTGAEVGGALVGATPRHLTLNADGSKLYVGRFITPRLPGEDTANVVTQSGSVYYGGEVLVLDPGSLGTTSIVTLRHSDDLDFENQGSGIPNYLGPVVISPDGSQAWVPSKKDNISRGTLRSGGNLNFQNTVRAISSRIDLATDTESFGARIDHDNASMASAAAFDRYGVFMFVALETSREIAVINAHDFAEFFRISVGRAPQGVTVSADGYRLYVSNFMDRTVSIFDLTQLIDAGQWNTPLVATLQSVATESLSATVLQGKKLFYDARDTRLAREGYMSCASCHNDGDGDGRVWDLTGMGEGLRNTASLRGKGGMAHGFLHWTGNFDEVQDFEGQIRALAGGTGLMTNAFFNQGTRSLPLGDTKAGLSADLDALAAYVASLDAFSTSPYRNSNGTLTTDGVAGRTLFQSMSCAQCHGGSNFSESGAATLRDVGTISQPGSGTRLGATLTGLDTPTLRDVWSTAPYLHDGSAATLDDAVLAHDSVTIGGTNLAKLVSYLKQIDGQEPAPPPVGTPSTIAWQGRNIGAVAATGYHTEASGVISIAASGKDIWTAADEFYFVSKALSGNGELTARVLSWSNPYNWTKAGVMVREQTSANSRFGMTMLALVSGSPRTAFQHRTATGGTAGPNTTNLAAGIPYWVRIVRAGDVLTGYVSANGVNWTQRGTVTLAGLASTVEVGLAVTSHNDGQLSTVQFSDVSFNGFVLPGNPPPNQPPVASFTTSVTSGVAPLSVTFNASGSSDADGTITGYSWQFGDGTTGIGQVPTHVYSTPGSYSVTLTVTDDDEATGVAGPVTIQVQTPPDPTPPSIPTGVTVTQRTPNSLALSWQASVDTESGVAGYRVYVDGVLHGSTSAAQLSYTATGLTPATTYTLGVSAYNNPGLESAAAEVSDTTEPALPMNWQGQDIGAVAAAGSWSESNGTYSVVGSGKDIWTAADEFYFVSQPLNGNGEIVARLANWSNTFAWTKAGVMVREQLTAGSRYALTLLARTTTASGVALQYRTTTGGAAGPNSNTVAAAAPVWLRLVRSGDLLTSYTSTNGSTWTLRGTVTLPGLPSSVQIGLAVTSHNDGQLSTVQFDNVAVTGN